MSKLYRSLAYHHRIKGTLALLLAGAVSVSAVEETTWGRVKQAVDEEQGAAAKAAPGKGTVKPFELVVEALQDVNQATDVTVTTKVILPGFSAPSRSKHIQLKSFDTSGNLRWTKNEKNVALTPNGGASTAMFQYSDLGRHQPFQVQEQVQNAQTGNTEVLNAKGVVLLRPDIAVDNLTAPAQVHVGQIVNIVASLKELNGDLGAKTNVVLNEGATVRDHADQVSVNPLGVVDVVFATKFDQTGTYTLTAVAGDVVPGDYDNSNNAKSITIQVVDNVQSVPFYLYYHNTTQEYASIWNDGYSYGSHFWKGQTEYLYETLYLPGNALTFPVDKVSIQFSADNVPKGSAEVTNVPASYSYDDGCNSYAYGDAYAGDNTWVYLQNYSDCYWGYSNAYAQVNKYAEDYVYSYWYVNYWGTYSYAVAPQTGTFLNATSRVDTRFVVEDDGQAYGGDAGVDLWTSPWDYTWSDWYGSGYNRGVQYYGASSGMTQP